MLLLFIKVGVVLYVGNTVLELFLLVIKVPQENLQVLIYSTSHNLNDFSFSLTCMDA